MINNNWALMAVIGYCALFTVAVAAFIVWRIKRRKERAPVDFKLLRGPGESLRRRMAKYDEDAIFRLGGAALAPLVTAALPLWLATKFKPESMTQVYLWFAASGLVFVVTLVFSFRWAVKELMRYRNDRLGYLGERAVAESLSSLVELGFKIFHDVPAQVNGTPFNVDHVAVGLSGIYAIETQTRRKRPARPGFEEHKVTYDGRQLIWPWTDDDFGLRQAEGGARWISEWLNQMTGLGVTAVPVLALPGWYVIQDGFGPVLVANHKQLPSGILKNSAHVLTSEQVDLVGRQIESLCRDVEE